MTTSTPEADASNPFVKPTDEDLSIIGTLLDLDEVMNADVKRAERIVTIYLRPDVQADIDAKEAALVDLVGPDGKVINDPDAALGDSKTARARELADGIEADRQTMAASARQLRFRQLTDDDWTAFKAKHKKSLEAGAPFPDEMWVELVAACSAGPKMTEDQVKALRGKLGAPMLHTMAAACFNLNTEGGVSVPKSQLSSLVRRQQRPDAS